MKNLKALKLIATIAIGAIAASSANATTIQGDINIDGSGTLNGTGVNDATSLTSITATVGAGSTGDYAGLSGAVTFKDLNWTNAGYTGALALDDCWSIISGGVTYTFDLATITTNQVVGGTLVIQGTGTAQATGFTDNPGGIFSLSSSSSGTSISFSSTTSVPDSGHTAALLGLGMLGLAGLAKRLRK